MVGAEEGVGVRGHAGEQERRGGGVAVLDAVHA